MALSEAGRFTFENDRGEALAAAAAAPEAAPEPEPASEQEKLPAAPEEPAEAPEADAGG